MTRKRAKARKAVRHDERAPRRLGALVFFALPAAAPVWLLAAYVATRPGAWEHTAFWTPVVFLPLAAAAGVAGAALLKRGLVLGSALALALGGATALANPVIALLYLLPAGMMALTARKVAHQP